LKSEAEVLASVERSGWRVTGKRRQTRNVQKADPTGAVITVQEDTGNEIWTILDPTRPDVPPDELVVAPPLGRGRSVEFTVVGGPSKAVPNAPNQPAKPTATADLDIVRDPTTGRPVKLRDPATGQAIDLPDPSTTGTRATVVQGPNGAIYSWDGTNLTPLIQGTPDKPQLVQGARGAIYSWDGQTLTTVKAPEAKEREVAVVGNNLIDRTTGQVIYAAPEGVKFQTAQDGTILAIDPANPTAPQVIWKPTKPPSLIPGQTPTQKEFIQQDPETGALTAVDSPIYKPAGAQKLQEYLDSINQIEGMLTRGEIDIPTATSYKGALKANLDAALRGTTPYQEHQDREARKQARMQSGAGLLNQRVTSGSGLAQSLLNSAVGIVGNPNFMDPSAVAGFSPFTGAFDYVTALGGGPGVYDAAAGAVTAGLQKEESPADMLLKSAFSPPAAQQAAAPAPVQQQAAPAATSSSADALLQAALGWSPGRPITDMSVEVFADQNRLDWDEARRQMEALQPRNAFGLTAMDDPWR
jgi:hypothetical protein